MASRQENLKSLVTNSKTRIIILFTLFILIGAIAVGYWVLKKNALNPTSRAYIAGGGSDIGATPGSTNQTAEYVALQNKENIQRAETAMKTGTSSIPTIVDVKVIGENAKTIGPQHGTGGIGFDSLNRASQGIDNPVWQQDLIASECDSVSLASAVKNGANIIDLREHCSCQQLKDYGFKLIELMHACDCADLKVLGYTAADFRDNGSDAGRLKSCGFSACEMKASGFSATQMENGGFTEGELLGAGFTPAQVEAAGGVPPGMTSAEVKKMGCDPSSIKLLISKGASASAVRRISGCELVALKDAGYSAINLRDAGFTAADLKKEGFGAESLRSAGFEPRQLMNAGFVPADLEKAGFSQGEIRNGFRVLPKGVTIADVRQGGCDIKALSIEHKAGVRAPEIEKMVGCSAKAYKKSGFSDKQIIASRAPEGVELSDDYIRSLGCDPNKINVARRSGLSVEQVLEMNHCTLENLKNSGFTPKNLIDAGYTSDQLLSSGFKPKDVNDATKDIMDAIAQGKTEGCSVDVAAKARKAGMLASDLRKTIACNLDTLKASGYYPTDLKNAGFTPGEMTKSGFTPTDLVQAGYPPAELKSSGFDIEQLKNAGVEPTALLSAGFKDADLKKAGFSAKQMAAAGLTPEQLKGLGYGLEDLKNAGISAAQLLAAGFKAPQLAKAGFTSTELANAGVNQKIDALTDVTDVAEKETSSDEVATAPDMVSQNLTPVEKSINNINTALDQQKKNDAKQRFQQKIQQKMGTMQSFSSQLMQAWKQSPSQSYNAGTPLKDTDKSKGQMSMKGEMFIREGRDNERGRFASADADPLLIKSGDILFGTVTTSVNSDEPSPILATIVSGPLSGARIIGSFSLPSNAQKMIITFNTLSIPSQKKTISISAYAIDPNTGRTALSSSTNNHYLVRYGSLFASTFIQGLGNAFQSADTTISIGGNGTSTNTTITNGQNRTLTQNAVIGLATLGQAWAQEARKGMSVPTTVQVYSGTPIGILFLQDVEISKN